MSSAITRALYDRLRGDATLAAFLGTYASVPAVFTSRFVPPDAPMPYVQIGVPVTVDRVGTWAQPEKVRNLQIDLRLFATSTGDDDPIADAADRIAVLLQGIDLSAPPGWARATCTVINGPVDLPADTDADGRLVSIRVHLTR